MKNYSLQSFKKEVTDTGVGACLPKNLSNKWLSYLSEQIEDMLFDNESEHESYAEVTAAVIFLIQEKEIEKDAFSISYEDLYDYFDKYRIELSLETVHRQTKIKYEAATLDTIFTERDVKIWRTESQ